MEPKTKFANAPIDSLTKTFLLLTSLCCVFFLIAIETVIQISILS